MDKKTNLKTKVANFFGGLGYLACLTQWLWVVVLFFEPIKNFAQGFVPENSVNQPTVNPNLNHLSYDPKMAMLVGIFTFIVMILSIYVLIKIPMTAAKTSAKIVHKATDESMSLLEKVTSKKLTEKAKRKLSPRIILIIKLIFMLLPILLTFLARFLSEQIFEPSFAMYIELWLMLFCSAIFATEYAVAYFAKVQYRDLY